LGVDSRLEARDAHNFYLEMAAESGLVGLSLFGLLLAFSFNGLFQIHKVLIQAGRDADASLVKAYAIGLIGYLTAAFFLHSAYPRFLWLLLGIAMAVAQLAPLIWPQRLNGVVRYA
jgi:O-antigen ligase